MSLEDINERFLEAKQRLEDFEKSYTGSRNTSSYYRRRGAYLDGIKSCYEKLKKYGQAGSIYQVDVTVHVKNDPTRTYLIKIFYVGIKVEDIPLLMKRDFPKQYVSHKWKSIDSGSKYYVGNIK